VVVHPKHAGLPIVVLEGAAAGKPVIGTRVAGISEFIDHGINGLLVTYDDSRDLAIQLGRCLSQEKLDQYLGGNARKRAQSLLSLEAQRDRITALYEATVYDSR
jgi:glycosyltransferase involved in cell wall biosynthesis